MTLQTTAGPAIPEDPQYRAVAHDIADFVLAASWKGLPDKVQHEAVRTNLNWVGCALGGANTDTMEAGIRGILSMGASGATPVMGRRERFNPIDAAVLNCLGSAAHAFDDTHLKTITHPTGPVAAGLMACIHHLSTQGRKISSEDYLLALVLGIEIECRISNAVVADGKGANLGWYMTGISGGIGTAVAVGRLLGLDHAQMVSAIGLATAQACGVRSTHGSMATAYVPAIACRNGLTAAWMAAADFSCSEGSIDGRNGLMQVMSPNADASCIRRGLGSEFEMLTNAYKPYPCGIVIHPAIDAVLALLTLDGVTRDSIERVDLRVHPDALNLCWRKLPTTALDAQVSLYHWAAAALVRGQAGVAQSELACVKDPEIRAMQERLFPLPDPLLAGDQASATVRLKDGRALEVFVEHATGSAGKPMSDAQLEVKFMAMARRVLDDAQSASLLKVCQKLDSPADPLEIFRLGTV